MQYQPGRSWQEEFAAAVGQEDLLSTLSLLDARKTGHAGTPPKALKVQAARIIGDRYRASPEALFHWALMLAHAENDGAKEIGLSLLPACYCQHPAEVTERVVALSDDGNWEVREWAAGALGTLIVQAFEEVYPELGQWARHASPNVRRAVVVGIGAAGCKLDAQRCRLLLDVLELLLSDTSPYVKKNLGPFALGDSLLRCYPELVATWLKEVLHQENEQVRWNVAMAMTTAAAAWHFHLLRDTFAQLAADPRTPVRKAVYKAAGNLLERIPGELLPVVEGWRNDPLRAHVVQQCNQRVLA
jgi:hypothetical protein